MALVNTREKKCFLRSCNGFSKCMAPWWQHDKSQLLTQRAFWENSLRKFLPSPSQLARSGKLLDLIMFIIEQSTWWNCCHLKGYIMRFSWSTHTFLSVVWFRIYKPSKWSDRAKSRFKQTSEHFIFKSAVESNDCKILWFLLSKASTWIVNIDK